MIQPNRTVRNYTYDWRDEKEFFGLKGEPFGARFLNASGGGFAGTRLQCVHLLQVFPDTPRTEALSPAGLALGAGCGRWAGSPPRLNGTWMVLTEKDRAGEGLARCLVVDAFRNAAAAGAAGVLYIAQTDVVEIGLGWRNWPQMDFDGAGAGMRVPHCAGGSAEWESVLTALSSDGGAGWSVVFDAQVNRWDIYLSSSYYETYCKVSAAGFFLFAIFACFILGSEPEKVRTPRGAAISIFVLGLLGRGFDYVFDSEITRSFTQQTETYLYWMFYPTSLSSYAIIAAAWWNAVRAKPGGRAASSCTPMMAAALANGGVGLLAVVLYASGTIGLTICLIIIIAMLMLVSLSVLVAGCFVTRALNKSAGVGGGGGEGGATSATSAALKRMQRMLWLAQGTFFLLFVSGIVILSSPYWFMPITNSWMAYLVRLFEWCNCTGFMALFANVARARSNLRKSMVSVASGATSTMKSTAEQSTVQH